MANYGRVTIGGIAAPPSPPSPPAPLAVTKSSLLEPLSTWLDEAEVDGFLRSCTRAISPFYEQADVGLRSVAIKEVSALSRQVEQHRLKRANELLTSMRSRRVDPFGPIAIGHDADSEVWLIFPPIVEFHARRNYLINGHHRLTAAHEAKVRRVQLITIRNVTARAPAKPVRRWSQLARVRRWLPTREPKLVDLEGALVRPASSFFRSQFFYFETLDQLVNWCRWFSRTPIRYLWDPQTHRLVPPSPAHLRSTGAESSNGARGNGGNPARSEQDRA